MSPISAIKDYIIGAKQELKKVVWPSRKEIIQHTSMVIFISLSVAVFLGVIVDFSLIFILEHIF